jgi:hypothetical protein
MNSFFGRGVNRLVIAITLATSVLSLANAQMLTFSKSKSTDQVSCLKEALRESSWQNYPGLPDEMVRIAQVTTTVLNDQGRPDYVYVLEDGIDWCGTAGCKLLIAERRRDGTCHLLYDGMGDKSFTVLHRRDHGYRRIYAPCEARFDGHQYQQFHKECPNVDIHH